MRLTVTFTLAAISAFALPATAAADAPTCSTGYQAIESAGGPLCVGAVYLDGTWNDDPHTCLFGFYQGSCAPEPADPVWQTEEAYEFQLDDDARAAWTPAGPVAPPADPPAPVEPTPAVEPATANVEAVAQSVPRWLGAVRLGSLTIR